MTDVDRAILEAWQRIGPSILADPDELAKRIARRRSATLTRPLRHWCIAIRASDRRITPMHWIITPEHAMDLNHPDHPYEPIEHQVTIQTYALDKFCRPVATHPWGVEVPDLARSLGCSPAGLRTTRHRDFMRPERRIKGLGAKWGHPVPLISAIRPLDPGSGNCFEPPHPICGNLWQHLPDVLPHDFEQTVIRKPVFRRLNGPPLPPGAACGAEEVQLFGWRWLCPGCRKEVKTIYYPIEARNLCYYLGHDPAVCHGRAGRASSPSLEGFEDRSLNNHSFSHPSAPPQPLSIFACNRCHRIRHYSSINPSSWNQLITHLSAGLLYGHEVPPPPGFQPTRKRTRCRQITRQAPRRQQILRRLLNGWSVNRIARDMHITVECVNNQLRILCRQENVPDRHALAAKLGASKSPPLNQMECAARRRFQVMELLLAGHSYRQIIAQLDLDWVTLNRDTQALYKLHGVKGHGFQARRALAAKLNRQFPPTPGDLLRQKIAALRESGLPLRQIAKELNRSYFTVKKHSAQIHRGAKLSNSKCESSTSPPSSSQTELSSITSAPAVIPD